MCGIVGYIGKEQAAPIILDGLARLEYRGYDSAGAAAHISSGFASNGINDRIFWSLCRLFSSYNCRRLLLFFRIYDYGTGNIYDNHGHYHCVYCQYQ